jgi:hypothetical protein
LEIDDILKLREYLVKKKEELEGELKTLDTLISLLEEVLKNKSFMPATELLEEKEVKKEAVEVAPAPSAPIRSITLVKYQNRNACYADIYEDRVVIHVSREIEMPTSDRLVKYIIKSLEKYLEEDLKAQAEGRISPSMRFYFSMDEDDRGNLVKIEFVDHGVEDRRRELINKIRWAVRTFVSEKEGFR